MREFDVHRHPGGQDFVVTAKRGFLGSGLRISGAISGTSRHRQILRDDRDFP
ncbi:hypothetical protein [Streptomyces sp. NPDC047123]|uniref:hypothetical protein n=1 Tax=Streptomyces sp. NPDC047123 TaxID=3155622 RepID=UPI0034024662